MRNSYIVYLVKIESVSKITVFSLKVTVKSFLDFFFEIPPCGKKVIFFTEFVILGKNLTYNEVIGNKFRHEGISK